MFKKYKVWLALLLAACVLAYVNLNMLMDTGKFELLHLGSGEREIVSLPLSRISNSDTYAYELRGQITFGWAASKILHITPDDAVRSIVINGKNVDLSAIPAHSLNDWAQGFLLDVGPYVSQGENSISITFSDDYGGYFGMKINSQYGREITVISILWLALAIAAIIKIHTTVLKISRWHSALYCLIILGAVLRVWTICTYNPMDHIGTDMQRHWEQGNESLRNDLMSNSDPIMYQLYIGALAKLTLGMPALVAFYTSILALITPWVWYRFFRELQRNKTLALAGWAFISLLPSWISIYSYYMQETLFLPLLGAALWATWRARRKATVSSFAWMVLIWILAGLTRGIAIPLAAVSCTALWVTQEHKLKKALISACILLFALGPLTYRSYQTVHHFAPHGMGHLASIYAKSGKKEIALDIENVGTYGFGSPSTGVKPFQPFSDWETQREGIFYVNVNLEKGREDWDKAYEKVALSKDSLWIIKENLIFLFFGPSWPDDHESRTLDRISTHMRWIWLPAFLGAAVWIFILRRRLHRQWLLPSLILTWFIVQGLLPIAVNEGRYRKPFEGLIIAQLVLLAAANRGQAKTGQPYSWSIDPRLSALARKTFTGKNYRPDADNQ